MKKANLLRMLMPTMAVVLIGTIILLLAAAFFVSFNNFKEEAAVLRDQMHNNVSEIAFDSSEPSEKLDEIKASFKNDRNLKPYVDSIVIADKSMTVTAPSSFVSNGTDLHIYGVKGDLSEGVSAEFIYQGDQVVFCTVPVSEEDILVLITRASLLSYYSNRNIYQIVTFAILIFVLSITLTFFIILKPFNSLIKENEDLRKTAHFSDRKIASIFLERIVSGTETNIALPPEAKADRIRFDLLKPNYLLMIVKDHPDLFLEEDTIAGLVPDSFWISMENQKSVLILTPSVENINKALHSSDKSRLMDSYTKVLLDQPVGLDGLFDAAQVMRSKADQRIFEGRGKLFICTLFDKDASADWEQIREYQSEIDRITNSFYLKKTIDATEYINILHKTDGNVVLYRSVLKMIHNSLEQLTIILQKDQSIEIGRFDESDFEKETEQQIIAAVNRLITSMKDNSQQNLLNYAELVNNEIEKCYRGNLFGVNDIAEKAEVSPAYLSKVYKQTTGFNIAEQIQNRRMTEAILLLQEDEIPTNTVYSRIGYSNNNYFYRVFKKYYGITPGAFRKLSKEEQHRVIEKRRAENEKK